MVSLPRHLLTTDYPPSDDITTNDPPSSEETDFDANMVLVLAVLLFALVAALVLNSVIHVILRRRREAMMSSVNNKSLGIEKRALRKIPVAVFRLRRGVLVTECSICLGDFVDGEKVRVLPECNHEFHVKCVDKWLAEHTSCPNCRRSLVVVDGGERAGVAVRVEQGGGGGSMV